MNFRIKNFKKGVKAQANQVNETAKETVQADVNAAEVVQGLSQEELVQLLAANSDIQAIQAEAIAEVQAPAPAPAPAELPALTPENEALIAAYMEREKQARIKRMHEAKKKKQAERKRLAEEAEAAEEKAKAQIEAFKAEQARLAELARAEREAKEAEAAKQKLAALQKQKIKLEQAVAIQTAEAEIKALQAKLGKAQGHVEATKVPDRTVVAPKPKVYDDNFIIALRAKELLKAAKKPESKSVRMYVQVGDKKIPMKDAFRAITGSTATNDELDSSAIARFFDKHGIKYVRES